MKIKKRCVYAIILAALIIIEVGKYSIQVNAADGSTVINNIQITHIHSGSPDTGGGCYSVDTSTSVQVLGDSGAQYRNPGTALTNDNPACIVNFGSINTTGYDKLVLSYGLADLFGFDDWRPMSYNWVYVNIGFGSQNALLFHGCRVGPGSTTYGLTQDSSGVTWDVSGMQGTYDLTAYATSDGGHAYYNARLFSATLVNVSYGLGCGHANTDVIANIDIIKTIAGTTYTLAPSLVSSDPICTNATYTWSTGETGVCNVTGDGDYILTINYQDNGVARTATKTCSVTDYDFTPPTMTLSQDITNYTNGNVIITANAADNKGVDHIVLPDNSSGAGATTTYTVTANGTYNFIAYDAAGNSCSVPITITNIDKTVPTVSSGYDNGTFVQTGTISITAADGESGLAAEPYSWDGVTWTSSNSLSVTTNGSYSVIVKDVAGNCNSITVTVSNIDITPPTGSCDYDNSTYVGFGVLSLVAADGESGLAAEPYSWDGVTWTSSTTMTVTANGTYVVTIRDAIGNSFNLSIDVTNIDHTAPSGSFQYDSSLFVRASTLGVIASDGESGLAAEPYSWDGATWTSNGSIDITANGTYTVIIKDFIGNTSTVSIDIANIDTTPPQSTVNQTEEPATEVVIQLDSLDTESGLAAAAYSWDGGVTWTMDNTLKVTDNGDYTALVVDNAGNVEEKTIPVKNIDKIAPDLNVTSDDQAGYSLLTIDASDTGSGLAALAYSWDGGKTWTTENTLQVTESGTYTVKVRDAAGNISSMDIAVTIKTIVTITDSNIPFQQQFLTSATTTTTTGFLFIGIIYLFSSAAIYRKDANGKYVKIGKCRINKKYGYYQVKIGNRLYKKIASQGNNEILIYYSPLFVKHNLNKEIVITIGKKKHYKNVTHKSVLNIT